VIQFTIQKKKCRGAQGKGCSCFVARMRLGKRTRSVNFGRKKSGCRFGRSIGAWLHDANNLNRIRLSSLCLTTVFSGFRFPDHAAKQRDVVLFGDAASDRCDLRAGASLCARRI
jgi:hypothetical protein